MEKLVLFSIFLSFLVTALVLPSWIKKAKKIGLVWQDMNKTKKKMVAGSGGLIVVIGFILGVLTYIALETFYFKSNGNIVEVFALTSSILLLTVIAFVDDIFGWQHGGLRKRYRLIFALFAAIPLMVINAGTSTVHIPLVGVINIGVIYPLFIIPIGIVGATTTFNFIAGYNGLEAGQGMLVLSALAIASFITGSVWLSVISLCMVASLFAFLLYNSYPAKIFPGDVMTYPVGALIAIMAILGNYERFAVFIFIPYILETGLKLRGKLVKESLGAPQKDGSIKNKYDKIYGLEHLAIRLLEKFKRNRKAYEVEVVMLIYMFQTFMILLGFGIFFT